MINEILKTAQFEEVSEGIFSCLGVEDRSSDYDNKVKAYDLVVGNSLYNRLVWGNWPSAYRDFCMQSLASAPDGIILDAGCGSLVFTAGAYAQAENELVVLLDRSLGMLEQGRNRIIKIRGYVPDNIVFVQGDIFNLPFKDHVFDVVSSFGVVHIFDDKFALLTELERVKREAGQLFFSSLVGNNAIGRKYLDFLKQAGEVATCHSSASLENVVASMPYKYRWNSIGNMAYAKSA